MTIDLTAPTAQPEGTALPPPPRFGEISTLTLPRGRRSEVCHGTVTGLGPAAGGDDIVRAEIMRSDPTALTITL